MNQPLVWLIIFTNNNITGTSVKTPTVVTKTTGEFTPNKVIATATDNSKKSEAPIKAAGAATLCGCFVHLQVK